MTKPCNRCTLPTTNKNGICNTCQKEITPKADLSKMENDKCPTCGLTLDDDGLCQDCDKVDKTLLQIDISKGVQAALDNTYDPDFDDDD